jgi:hypothetical protein
MIFLLIFIVTTSTLFLNVVALNSCQEVAESNCSATDGVFALTPFPDASTQRIECSLASGFTPLLEFNMSDYPPKSAGVACKALGPALSGNWTFGCSPPADQVGMCSNFSIASSFEFNEVVIEPLLFASGTPDGFSKTALVDGLAVVTGDTNEIVWAFAISNDAPEVPSEHCPCDAEFRLDAKEPQAKLDLVQSGRFWCDQVMRGSFLQVRPAFEVNSRNLCAPVKRVGRSVQVTLRQPSSVLVVMLCRDQTSTNEDVYLHSIRLSVRETPAFVRPPCRANPPMTSDATFALTSASTLTSKSISTSTLTERLTLPPVGDRNVTATAPSPVVSTIGVDSSTPLPIGAIVGGSVGGFVLVLLMGAAIGWCFARRKKDSPAATRREPEMPTHSPSASAQLSSSNEYSRLEISGAASSSIYEVGNLQQ